MKDTIFSSPRYALYQLILSRHSGNNTKLKFTIQENVDMAFELCKEGWLEFDRRIETINYDIFVFDITKEAKKNVDNLKIMMEL